MSRFAAGSAPIALGLLGMTISPALAHPAAVDTGSAGGGRALLIIIAVGLTVFLVRAAWNRWRRPVSTKRDSC